MHLTVTGKPVDVGDALRHHVDAALEALLGKYFGTAIEAHAVFAREAHLIRAELSLHIGRGMVINSGAAASDHYLAFDAAAERLAKQLRRYKRRLRDYHGKARAVAEQPEIARSFVLAPVDDADDADDADEDGRGEANGTAPVVIAEMSTELPRLTVGEAVMRMDLADTPVLLFRNRSHGGLNLVYRRGDGNVGWIDPALDAAPGRRLAGAPP
ncbi:MAG TPA: ribosome-associated translation inhibitor RaiA, partial [Stellaceae bacterium]|nr:ribosome-associated translation inhibitor RaiA [Stellaceae bacterium]